MRKSTGIFLASAVLLSAFPLYGADCSFHGTYSSSLYGLYNPMFENRFYGYALSPLDAEMKLSPSEWLEFSASGSLSVRLLPEGLPQDIVLTGGRADDNFLIADPPERILPPGDADAENIGLYIDLAGLAATIYLPFADVYIGRQLVSWGSAHVINPSDIFGQQGLTRTDTGTKKGIDAVRVRIPFGMMNEIDLGFAGGKDLLIEESAFFLRIKGYFLETDAFVLVMDDREDLLIGVDITRPIGKAGTWIEGVTVIPDTFAAGGENPRTDHTYVKTSAGIDYQFNNSFYGFIEYHFNSAGKTDPADYADIPVNPGDNPAYDDGKTPLMGTHYLGAGFTYQITPLLPISTLILFNICDQSFLLSSEIEYNFAENIYLTGGISAGLGKEPESLGGIVTSYGSEFGAYPMVVHTSLRIYF
ncbi:MAG: hypothetical protein JW881_09400 [Spirochaetales bacterium]|nr:hypothetical protein [Spirochaetales bacterium]